MNAESAAECGAVRRPDISVVIVSRNTRDVLRSCLASIAAHTDGLLIETIIVDNASTDGTAAMVRREYPRATLLEAAENGGFARGNNLGIRRAAGRAVLLLNPDAELAPGALHTLWNVLTADETIGVVGPQLVYPDGTVQPSRYRFPTLGTALVESTVIGEWWPTHPAIAWYTMADVSDRAAHDADWLMGACLLVRRDVFDAAGLLDARLFLYSEEPEFCGRVRRAGWRVRYVPEAVVRHHEGASTGQAVPVRQRAFAVSKAYLIGRQYGPWIGAAARAGLVADQTVRLGREGAKWLLGHKREMRAARIAAAWLTLRALLDVRSPQ